jgi:hypothetical protein
MTQCVITLEKEYRVNSRGFFFLPAHTNGSKSSSVSKPHASRQCLKTNHCCAPQQPCTHYAKCLFNDTGSQHLHGTFPQKPRGCSADSSLVRDFHAICADFLIGCFCGDVADISIGTGQFLLSAMILLYVRVQSSPEHQSCKVVS